MTPENKINEHQNGNGQQTANTGDPNRRVPTEAELRARLVANMTSMRDNFFSRFLDSGPRDINRECMYPSDGELNNPWFFRELYNREPIATRVVQLMPKESWQVSPLVYEDEDPENDTEFERAWDELGQAQRGEVCFYQDEDGSPIWEHLARADQLSGIGYFGVILVGIDDGRNLDQPADGVMTLNPTTNRMWPSRPRATSNPNEPKYEVTTNRDGTSHVDVVEPSPLMVPVVNRRKQTVDFVLAEHADRLVANGRLTLNAPPLGPRADRGFGPHQDRHDQDASPARTSSGEEPFSPIGGASFTSFAGAQGTDAQYVGVELSPPEYPETKPSKQRRKLLFLRCFDEALVQIVQYEADVRNPRFGLPVMYRITLNDPSTQHSGVGLPLATVRVHWSRIIHLADNLDSSEIFGVPRLRPVLNPVLDVRKIRGAGAEGYWKSCFTGLALSTHPQLGGDVAIDEEKSKAMLQEYFMNLDRGMLLMGMSANTIAPSVVDPTPHININIEAVCIQLGCPIRVFKGSERGELASSQDDSSWNDRVKHRQRNYLTPRVIIPFIDRMISLGVLPVPKVGKVPPPDQDEDKPNPAQDARMKNQQDDDEDVGEESNDGESQAAKEDTGGPAVGQGTNPFLKRGTANRGRWYVKEHLSYLVRNTRTGRLRVINAQSTDPENDDQDPLSSVAPDEKVIGKKSTKSDVYKSQGGYSIEWPDIDSTTHKDKAGIALQETQALAAYVQGNLETIIPPEHFYTDVMQWPEERSKQIIEDAKGHQAETMTMPPAGDPEHPASDSPAPPPKPVNPLQVPKGTSFKGPGDQNPLGHPGGIAFTPKPPPGMPVQPGQPGVGVLHQNPFAGGQQPPVGGGAVAQKNATESPKMPVQNVVEKITDNAMLPLGQVGWDPEFTPLTRNEWRQSFYDQMRAAELTGNAFDPEAPRGPDGVFLSDSPVQNEGWITLESGQHVYIGDGGDFQPGGPKSEPVQKGLAAKAEARVPATVDEATRRIDRFEKLFRSRGNHEVADWMGKLRDHVKAVGTDEALKQLGAEGGKGGKEQVQYVHGFNDMGHFAQAYLDRHGITSAYQQGTPARTISSVTKSISSEDVEGLGRGVLKSADKKGFLPKDPNLANKLEEAKRLPGLEKSEDINKVAGHQVTHLTPEVMNKLDDRYGKGKWIVKAYGDEASAGYGIYFPQRAAQIQADAKSTIHEANAEVGKHGFSLRRDEKGNVVGLQHQNGDRYDFGTKKYNDTIDGHVRHWADKAHEAAPHEHGAQLPDGGKDFMAQPAFKAVGVSDADRAAGRTIAPGEGRVHIVTKNGVASVVPHSTWIKGEHLPVVFESDDTRAMAKAAVDAINKLPKSERSGQIYAPDIIKAEGGYRVVEANPANSTGSSGYLNDNPLIIDSYVSHLTGREPGHVRFIRGLLSTKR